MEAKDFTTDLIDKMEKAFALAVSFKEKTVGLPFTLIKLSQLTRISFDDCRHKINSLATYGLVNKERRNGVDLFTIKLDAQSRILFLEKEKQKMISEISYINAVQQVIQQEVEDANPEPIKMEVVKKEEHIET